MNKSALKDKRRETVIGLLKGMSIKSGSSGDGFDKDDVYACIQELTNLYEDHIDELEKNYEAEIRELNKKYHKYDENNELYVSLIMEAKKSSNEIINQAKEEVDEILNNGKEQIARQEKQIEHMRDDYKKEQESIDAELKAHKNVAKAEKAAMKVEIEAEKEKLEAEKNKYRQLIASMDGEFAEIRTNLLRTSAIIDALKAQAEEVTPVIEWDVEQANDVQIPTSDIEFENILDLDGILEEAEAEPVAEKSEKSFEDTFFKSEVLNEAPAAAAEPVVEEPVTPEPVVEEKATPAPAEETYAPVEETPAVPVIEEATAEDLLASMDALAEKVETPEPAVEEIPAAVPAVEPEVKPENVKAEEPATDTDEDIEALLDEITFDDLLNESATLPESEEIEEISIEDLDKVMAAEEAPVEEEPVEEVPVAEAPAAVTEEISFEGLEALFKDEK